MNSYGNKPQRPASIPGGPDVFGMTQDNPAANVEHDVAALVRTARPFSDEAQRHLDDLQRALEELRNHGIPKASSIAWPAGLNRQVVLELPLKLRTRNCLSQRRFLEGTGPLKVRDLMIMENFGRTSLHDLLGELEVYLKACIHDGTVAPHPRSSTFNDATSIETHESERAFSVYLLPDDWNRTAEALGPLLAAAAELNGLETVAGALSGELSELAANMKITSELESIKVENLVIGSRGPVSVALDRLDNELLAMSPAQRIVVEHRMLREPQPTLAEVGLLLGVTRERIRQHQVKVEARILEAMGSELRLVASVLGGKLEPIMAEQAFHRRIDATLGSSDGTAQRLFRRAVVAELGYTCQQGTYMNDEARSVVSRIRSHARKLTDDAGLVDERSLRALLPNEDWQPHWPLLLPHTGLHQLHGSVTLRNSAKARAKSALVSIGHAATREEIAAVCGLTPVQVTGAFSNIPSVVKATKDRWALKEWVDDEYEGIVAEIIQRIEEDGGSTTTERLLNELPEKFHVSAISVRAYMQTPRFLVRDGRISLANVSSLKLRPLDDAVHGRDPDGAPYWTFAVESRFFDGYSVTGVPPEFAKALGCDPDGGTHARIENLPLCRDLSVRWPVATTTGASLGYLADALRELGLQKGQWVRVTLKGRNLVELSEHRDPSLPDTERPADAILARMKNRRRVL